jgi:CheY-like chemotaxis protein
MDREIVLALVGIAPQILVLLIIVIGALVFRGQIGKSLGGRVTSVSVFGLRMDLDAEAVDKAVAERESTIAPAPGHAPSARGPAEGGGQVVERANRLASHLHGRTILWVDDQPANNRIERRLLRQMGIFVEAVVSNAEAMAVLDDRAESIAVVISDVARASGPSGLDLAKELANRTGAPRGVFYIGRVEPERPLPAGAFGIADRPDDLLNLVMDALDRAPART